jgi:peptidoglycan/xylan/chitin deacetylase (PgdA/CDA1 family)
MKRFFLILFVLANALTISVFADSCKQYRAKYHCPGTDKKPIHLSFDDGPANLTPVLLDTLKRERIPATFFILAERIDCQPHKQACTSGNQKECQSYNYCLQHRNTLKRAKQEGHTIGSHSYSHIRLSTIPATKMLNQIQHSKQLLTPFFNTSPALFRLPYGDGWFNRDKSTLVLDTLKKNGFQHIAWEMSAYDWRESDQHDDKILQTVMKEICSKRGGVILFHDGDHKKEDIGRTFTGDHIAEWIPAMRCVADFKPLSFFYKDLQKR